jgi:NAD(P)-dependent dehydrogenase (short-subunit alcohol dehydrogenase family)
MTVDLRDRVAIVTGGGSGIGRAAALEFARSGASVGILDIDWAAASDSASSCIEEGGSAVAIQVDVADEDSVMKAVSSVVAEFGRLDCALNNAAVPPDNLPLDELDTGTWARLIAVNLSGVFFCLRAEIPVMRRGGGGSIVNTASTAGLVGMAAMPAYVASKHGVVGLSKAAAIDYGPVGIRVNALCPGSTLTPMMEAHLTLDSAEMSARTSSIPLRRFARPEEIARTAVWMCSEDASFMTGAVVRVDGGRRA